MSKQKTITLAAIALRSRWLALSCVVAGACLLAASPAVAAQPTPGLSVFTRSEPTHIPPGFHFEFEGFNGPNAQFPIMITNVGSGPTDGSPLTVTDTLPNGMTPTLCQGSFINEFGESCTISGQTATMTFTGVLKSGQTTELAVRFEVPENTPEGTYTNTVSVSGGGATPVTIAEPFVVSSTNAPFGLTDFSAPTLNADGSPSTQAGGHPWSLTTNVTVTTTGRTDGRMEWWGNSSRVSGDLKDILVNPPLGLIGNPQAVPMCTQDEFREQICPASSQVGVSRVDLSSSDCECAGTGPLLQPVYNMIPPPGVPAQFAFSVDFGGIHVRTRLNTRVHSGGDYGLTISTSGIAQSTVLAAPVTLWGVPADPSHDDQRCKYIWSNGTCTGTPGTNSGPNSSTAAPKPFLTMPTACPGTPLRTLVEVDSWQESGKFVRGEETQPAAEGCESLDFSPTLKARPTTDVADSPSGLSVDLHLPVHEGCTESAGEVDVCENAEAELENARVTLPEGFVVNPSGANGLDGCSAAQIGYQAGTSEPAEFTPGPAECPDASRIGTVKVKTQVLDHPLPGSVYLAKPYDNPFGSLLALYIAVYDPASGVVLKLPGHVETDPQTGRLTTTFDENPQLPFEDLELEFFKGATAPLMTPPTCGSYATSSSLASWAGQSASPGDKYAIDRSPGGGSCASAAAALPNSPSFSAGTVTPIAGAFSPFVLNLRREDGSQRLSVIETTLPEGLLGKLAGVSYCPQAAIDAAAKKSGREEQASPSCPSASELGSVVVGAGAGPAPYYVPGKVYLAGPYEGAPISIVVITPAVAGPFDLGTVVTRVALQVDPATAQITAKSDPLPSVLKAGGDGLPLDIRSIVLKLDRPSFTLNPTSCDPLSVGGTSLSTLGQGAALTDRFQVGECGGLAFGPKLSLSMKGSTKRTGNPALKAVLTMPPGGANIAQAQVTLPKGELVDNAHIGNVCARSAYLTGSCPADSVIGHAQAITPLLEAPLEGPVYLVSGYEGHTLPDVGAELNGQIRVLLHGKTDSVHQALRSTFELVPDAPVTKFTLSLDGGKKGLIENGGNGLCAGNRRALALFTGQNGKTAELNPKVHAKCTKATKKHRKHRRRASHR